MDYLAVRHWPTGTRDPIIGGVNALAPPAPASVVSVGPLGLSPLVAGTACCAVSALGYAAAQICLRYLSWVQADPMWVIFNKELVTVIVVGLWLLRQASLRRKVMPPGRMLAMLLAMGLAVQLIANPCQQWAFGVVGLAITIPVTFGVSITAGAVLGLACLKERVTTRSVMAMGLLVVAIAALAIKAGGVGSTGAEASLASGPALAGHLPLALGIAAACASGAIFALLSIAIRHSVTGVTPVSTVVFLITLMGVIGLGPISAYRLGIGQLLATPPEQFGMMLAAGVLNLIAFLALTKGLQLTTVVHANVLNASQVAMAAIAGMLIFREPATPWLLGGVVLTIVGIMLIDGPRTADCHVEQPI